MHETLCCALHDELGKIEERIEKQNGEISTGDIKMTGELLDQLKDLYTIDAMDQAGYSNEDGSGSYRGNSYRGNSYRDNGMSGMSGNSYNSGNSYARRRNSMGQFTDGRGRTRGYSRADGNENMKQGLRELLDTSPDEKTRQKVQRLMDQMENGN